MGAVLCLSLGAYAALHDKASAAVLALSFGAALLAFLRFNWYPARVFPGDLNHTVGAVVVCVTLLGNMEKFSILCFTPWIAEAFLKLASRFKAESYGVLQEDGTVKPKDAKIRSLTHLVMSLAGFREWQVVQMLILLEAAVCAASFLLVQVIR
jgi:UDP-N-acetylglucosamine--dolichyl-phosphate N-acetylglucosaminephosphotransferase